MNKDNRPLLRPDEQEPSAIPVPAEPMDVWDMVNKYGTYEVQDTTDTDNVFPTIGYEGGWKNCMEALNITEQKKKTEP